MYVMTQPTMATRMEFNAPDRCVRSDEFEGFIRKRLFPAGKYDLMNGESDNADAPGDGEGMSFRFKSRENGLDFYVEARYAFNFSRTMIEWCRQSQLKHYQEVDARVPVYIIIGSGPQPAAPRQAYFFPVRNVRFNKLLRTNVEKFKISTNRSFEEKDLQ